MKRFTGFLGFVLLAVCAVALFALPLKGDNDPQTPYIQTVTPDTVKAGAEITVEGRNLGKAWVGELYLTTTGSDVKLAITTQKDEQIIAKLPANVQPGRYRLMILTTGNAPRFVEQPVMLVVE
jgi:IPT/TIG domain